MKLILKKGQIRCDVNVSISDDEKTLGTKVEVKKMSTHLVEFMMQLFMRLKDKVNLKMQDVMMK